MTASIGAESRSRRDRRAMRKCVAYVAFALLAAAALAAPVLADEASLNDAAMSRGWNFDEQGGEKLFGHVCAACVLLDGLRGMPPLGRMMSDEQVADVVNYVRTHFGNSYADALSPADVAAARRRVKSELR
jgi:mono/diheme cytochrome c family protein